MADERMERLVRRTLGRMHATDEWDQPPFVRFVSERDGRLFLDFDALPPEHFSATNIATVADLLLYRQVNQKDAHDALESVRGVLCYSEAWMLELDADDTDAHLAVEAFRLGHRLSEHPDRVETKIVTAMDLDQTFYAANAKRGRDFDPAVTVTDDVVTDEHGVMPDAMAKLTIAIRKVQNDA